MMETSSSSSSLLVATAFWYVVSSTVSGARREWCADRPWSSSGDVRRVRIVDAPMGSAVTLSCAYCGETDDKSDARIWYTSPRLRLDGMVVTAADRQEVVLGMADPLDSNRVYMTADHSLIIQNLTRSDVRRYTCSGLGYDGRNNDVEFAVDLLPRSDPVRSVSADSMYVGWTRFESRYLAPIAGKFQRVRQIEVDWDPWGSCDGCAGKRYRRAACRVRFVDGARMACRSIGLPAIVSPGLASVLSSVPDFLLAETCYAYCQLTNKHRFPKYRNTFVLEEGSSLTLVCAEATINDQVIWRRDGLVLTENSGTSGASLDTFGTLYMVGLTVDDSGNYTCYVNGNRTQEVLLAVQKSSMLASTAYRRHLYYLCYAFALYSVVFTARIYYAYLNRGGYVQIAERDVLAQLSAEIPAVYLGKKIRIR